MKIRMMVSTFLLAVSAANVSAFESTDLMGTWCFYEQEAAGNVVPERVTITFEIDGTYQWRESHWKQNGSWSVEENTLIMSDVGSHELKSVTTGAVVMERYSTMRMRRGAC